MCHTRTRTASNRTSQSVIFLLSPSPFKIRYGCKTSRTHSISERRETRRVILFHPICVSNNAISSQLLSEIVRYGQLPFNTSHLKSSKNIVLPSLYVELVGRRRLSPPPRSEPAASSDPPACFQLSRHYGLDNCGEIMEAGARSVA